MLNRWGAWFSLFASTGTLFCCALPSLLVTFGMGASLASFIGVFPQVIWISQYKNVVFVFSGVLIFSTATVLYLNRNAPCPTDPKLAQACIAGRRWSIVGISLSSFVWLVGAFFAFIAPMVL